MGSIFTEGLTEDEAAELAARPWPFQNAELQAAIRAAKARISAPGEWAELPFSYALFVNSRGDHCVVPEHALKYDHTRLAAYLALPDDDDEYDYDYLARAMIAEHTQRRAAASRPRRSKWHKLRNRVHADVAAFDLSDDPSDYRVFELLCQAWEDDGFTNFPPKSTVLRWLKDAPR